MGGGVLIAAGARPRSAGYYAGAPLGDLEARAERGDRLAGAEIVRRVGFDQARELYGSGWGARDFPGSWFEPPIRDGWQWVSTDWFPWWKPTGQDAE